MDLAKSWVEFARLLVFQFFAHLVERVYVKSILQSSKFCARINLLELWVIFREISRQGVAPLLAIPRVLRVLMFS